MRFNYVERGVALCFKRLGRVIAAHPWWFIVVPLAFTLLMALGARNFKLVHDPEYLFTPRDGRGKLERAKTEALFPMNYSSGFDPSRETRVGRYGRLIAYTKDGSSILDEAAFDELLLLDRQIREITLYQDGLEWKYHHLCAKTRGRCWTNQVLSLARHLSAFKKGFYKIKYPFWIDPQNHQPVLFGIYLGGVKLDNESYVTSADAVTLSYYLDSTDPRLSNLILLWENHFLERMARVNFTRLEVVRMSSHTMGEQIEESAREVTPYISVTITLMFTLSVLACLSADWVRSKPVLGLAGCISANLAVGASFGACLMVGMEFMTSCMGVAFIMLGIGMDDTFVLLAAWRRTDPSKSVRERMSETFEHAGVSITITSLTNFLSFSAGTFTPFPSMMIFCTYSAVAVVFTFVFQVTFFGGFLALTGRAEKHNLHAITFRPIPTAEESKNRGFLYRLFCLGFEVPQKSSDGSLRVGSQHMLMEFFRNRIGDALTRTHVKALVFTVFLLYLALAGYGFANLEEGLKISDLYSYSSYARSYVLAQHRHFNNFRFRIQVVINHTFDYSDPRDQAIVEDMLLKLESAPFVASPLLTESWLRVFLWFIKEPKMYFARRTCDLSTKVGFYHCLKNVFFRLPQAKRFENDVVFNENFTEIVATRFIVQTHNWTSSNEIKHMILSFRHLVDSFPYDVTVFNQYFVFIDQYVMIRDYTIQAILATALLMNIVTFIFIPKITSAIWVGFSIISIQLGLIGYSALWGVNLNSISMMTYIMCIGFSVDNAAHVSYAYVSVKKKDPNDKIRESLFWVGLPVVQGSATTIAGVIILSVAPAYVYVVIFKAIFLVMLLSALHSIFLLPVLLSIFDTVCHSKNSEKVLPPSLTNGKSLPLPEHEAMLNNHHLNGDKNHVKTIL